MATTEVIVLADIERARESVAPYVHRTPMMTANSLGSQLGIRLHFKAEVFQKTGSFKPRGTFNKMLNLTEDEKARGVIAISAGNLAGGVAFAATALGIKATVIMPEDAPQSKVAATRNYGAEVILHGDVSTLFDKLNAVQAERNMAFIHPWNDPHLIGGHGTLGLEMLDDIPDPDYVIVPVGGGGLISGIASAIKLKNPRTKVIGVEPVGAPTMTECLRQNAVISLERIDTIASGLNAPSIGENNLILVKRFVDEIVLVSDDEIAAALGIIMERNKIVTEPAGATAFAAVLHRRFDFAAGAHIVCLLSGGNVDRSLLKEIL